jgi:hypothetical protein
VRERSVSRKGFQEGRFKKGRFRKGVSEKACKTFAKNRYGSIRSHPHSELREESGTWLLKGLFR